MFNSSSIDKSTPKASSGWHLWSSIIWSLSIDTFSSLPPTISLLFALAKYSYLIETGNSLNIAYLSIFICHFFPPIPNLINSLQSFVPLQSLTNLWFKQHHFSKTLSPPSKLCYICKGYFLYHLYFISTIVFCVCHMLPVNIISNLKYKCLTNLGPPTERCTWLTFNKY